MNQIGITDFGHNLCNWSFFALDFSNLQGTNTIQQKQIEVLIFNDKKAQN